MKLINIELENKKIICNEKINLDKEVLLPNSDEELNLNAKPKREIKLLKVGYVPIETHLYSNCELAILCI